MYEFPVEFVEKIQQKGVLIGIPKKILGKCLATFAQCSEEFLEKSFKKFPDTSLEKVLWKFLKEILQGD